MMNEKGLVISRPVWLRLTERNSTKKITQWSICQKMNQSRNSDFFRGCP